MLGRLLSGILLCLLCLKLISWRAEGRWHRRRERGRAPPAPLPPALAFAAREGREDAGDAAGAASERPAGPHRWVGIAYGTAGLAGGAGEGPASCSPAGAGGAKQVTGGRGRRGLARGGRKRRRLRRRDPLPGLVCHPGCPPGCGDRLETRLPGPVSRRVPAWAGRLMAGWRTLRCCGRLGGGGGAAVPGKQLRSGEGGREGQTDRCYERRCEWGQLTRLNFL